ncbi:MAG: hypothetical protein ACR2IE_13320 [Candidatus Sumerlaeaceae bacterium]
MGRRCDKPATRLVHDGRGFRTPLQECGANSLAFLQREIAALPRRPQYPKQKLRQLHQPRPAPTSHPVRSGIVTSLHWLLASLIVGVIVFSGLATLGRLLSPELSPLPTGVAPFGPKLLLTFALYAGTGCSAGAGLMYWLLRSSQN